MGKPLALVFVLVTLGALLDPRAARGQVPPRDSAELVATTQALVDAITTGDSAIWASHLAPSWLQTDEEGRQYTRGEFLREMHPLPAGQQGTLRVSHPRFTGDTLVAVISYDIDERHDYYGQVLTTRFHATDTYVRRRGRWWQLSSQVTALPTPIAGVPLDPALAREYAGRYALTPAIGLRVVATDSGLALEREGRPTDRLYALDERLFIRHGVRGFWVFERDGAGTVRELVNWRDNNAVRWHRVTGRPK